MHRVAYDMHALRCALPVNEGGWHMPCIRGWQTISDLLLPYGAPCVRDNERHRAVLMLPPAFADRGLSTVEYARGASEGGAALVIDLNADGTASTRPPLALRPVDAGCGLETVMQRFAPVGCRARNTAIADFSWSLTKSLDSIQSIYADRSLR